VAVEAAEALHDGGPATIQRSLEHWTDHSLKRFRERYLDLGISLADFLDIIPRIERRWREEFDGTSLQRRSLALVSVVVWSETLGNVVKVRLICDYRDGRVITALPHKLDPGKRRYLFHYKV